MSVPSGLIDSSRATQWDPGILADMQQQIALGADGLPVRTKVCAAVKPGDDIVAAIRSCPEGQVVELAAGKHTISSTLVITKGIVLRGAGSKGAQAGGTTLVQTGGGSVLQIGAQRDATCYNNAFGPPAALTEDAEKETTVVHVGDKASNFSVGDLALIDQVDDESVQQKDCTFYKRVNGRSISERVEIAAVGADTLTLTTPLHWTFRSARPYLAEIAAVKGASTKWAGIEGLYLQGGSNPGYNGEMAGGIDVSNAAYCWVKDVQTDATIGGMHVRLVGAYRCVVRDSHFHHSANYGFAQDCYGIALSCGTSDSLIENNIVRYMNKPIQFANSGGGNVVGYNYVDNAWATPGVQETTIDAHCAFPHMELIEGNHAPHMATPTDGVGNAGYLTYFRNYSSSQFAPPVTANSTQRQTSNVTAIHFGPGVINMNVVGNVLGSSAEADLGTAPLSDTYICEGAFDSAACILQVGPNGKSNVSFTTLWLHGNYDTVNQAVMWNPSITRRELPTSLYLRAQPRWWPAEIKWPWVGPDLTPMVGGLPAKARAEALAK